MRGCPDRDGDGVVDTADACPDEHGQGASSGCPPPPPNPEPPADPNEQPGSGPPDTDGEAPTYPDEPPGDDGFPNENGYDAVSELSCPADDPYKFVVSDDYHFELSDGFATPELANASFLASGRMLPPIPLSAYTTYASTDVSRRYGANMSGSRQSVITVTRGPRGGWTVSSFAACGAFLDAHLPNVDRRRI